MKLIRPTDVKMVGLTALGVVLAGYLMATFRGNNTYIAKASEGFDV